MARSRAFPTPAPTLGGPTESFTVERASATPVRLRPALPPPSHSGTARRTGTPITGPLKDLQAWFAAVVTHPKSVARGLAESVKEQGLGLRKTTEVERVVTAGPRLSALERLDVYHFAYHARLIECLADDYPTVQYALGERAFEALCRNVIQESPSRSPNLNFYGHNLLLYCQTHPKRTAKDAFIAELAELEWSLVQVLHAQAAPTLSLRELQAIPLDQWEQVRFPASQTVRLLRFTHPVNAYLQAYRENSKPRIPRPSWSATAVYRQGFTLWRMDLTPPMEAVLDRLFAGLPLGEALAGALEGLPAAGDEGNQAALAEQIMVWFREWVSDGFFAHLVP